MSSGPHILPSLPKVKVDAQRQALPYEPVCAIFRRYLHGQKLKFTPERAMMLDAVLRKNGLFEPEGLVEDLKKLGHRVSRATVYRTLAHLQDAGILKQVFFDNKQSYYEVIAGRQTQDYLICVESGRVIEFNSEKLRQLRDEICRQHGFEPLSHQFHIFGVCKPSLRPAAGGCPLVEEAPNLAVVDSLAHGNKRRQRQNRNANLHVPEPRIAEDQ
jgi:Fur family ferric uptake transcriptional regulator